MHFHLPKPLHGWREFAGEVGIIVIGVLIALGAEQAVEAWHWQHQVEQSKGAIKDELLGFASTAYERQVIQPCLTGRLQELATQLNGRDGEWRAMPERFYGAGRYYSAVVPVVYRAPARSINSDAWRDALADGTVNHLGRNDAQKLSSAYESAAEFKMLAAEEGSAETKLGPLGYDRQLGDATRVEMLQTVAYLDRTNSLLVAEVRDFFSSLRGADLGISRVDADAIRRDVLQTQRSYRGTCVRTDLPLDLGRG